MIRHPALAASGLLLLLVWAPLPFGSATPGFALLLDIAALLLAAAAPWLAPGRAPAPAATRLAAALATLALLGLLQTVPLPTSAVSRLAPERARLANENAELTGDPAPTRVPLSLAPAASRSAALDWMLPAAALVAAAQLGASRRARRALAVALLGSALFQVLFGARQWLVGSSAIWGVETPLAALRLRGTFVNPNHLALLLEIALAVALPLGWWSARRAEEETTAERRLLRLGVPLLVWCTLVAGLAFTGSRSGLLAAAIGALTQLALLARGRRRLWVVAGGGAAILAALGWVAWTGFEAGFGRLLATSAADSSAGARIATSARSAELFLRFPLFGSGLGSFLAAYPLVQESGQGGTWRHAHDDWVELLATTGVAGFLALLLALHFARQGLARAWSRARRSEDRAAMVAAVGALVAVGLHSLTDFGLTMPANAFALAVLTGAALAVGAAPSEAAEEALASEREKLRPPAATAALLVAEPASEPATKTG